MYLDSLKVNNFRNIASTEIYFPSRVTLIRGKNAQGKTSLIESLFVLSNAKSFRTPRLKELVRYGEIQGQEESIEGKRVFENKEIINNYFFIEGDIQTENGSRVISFTFKNNKKNILINNNRITKAEHFYGQFKVIEFVPDDLFILKGSPEKRRSFVDRIISMSDKFYLVDLISYFKALKNKNILLKSRNPNEVEITIWNDKLIELGKKISLKRRIFIKAFQEIFKEKFSEILQSSTVESLENQEKIDIIYQSDFVEAGADGNQKSKSTMETYFKEILGKEIKFQSSLVGIQRDDLDFLISKNSADFKHAKSFASQGQIRSIVLALKFSALEYLEKKTGEMPILVLDDVDSELDELRKKSLLELIGKVKNQVIITSTSDSMIKNFEGENINILDVENGRVLQ